ncbi:MAG TPA: isoaspartyl peptidase/L-asparaginase [Ktedonobacterales bacterium]
MGQAIIVHGGAGTIAPERFAGAREGCRAAALAGWRVLERGGSALDAVEAAIVELENNPGFNAGTGAVLTADGRAQLDAGMMDGRTLDVGAIAGVERIKNPIRLARRVLASPHVLLVGAGAEQFAVEDGLALCDPAELVTPAQRARWERGYRDGDDVNVDSADPAASAQGAPSLAGAALSGMPDPEMDDEHKHGTVGAVALDAAGRIVAAASTGGIAAKHPGRVGDTPLAGCGYYAEEGLGGVSSTGHGEDFIRLLLAKRAVDHLGAGRSAQTAASQAIALLGRRTGGTGGLIVLDMAGRVGVARNTSAMAFAFMAEGMSAPTAGV